MRIYLDVETLPDLDMTYDQKTALFRASVKKNCTKPATIQKKIDEMTEADENPWTKTACKPLRCKVYVISWAIESGPIRSLRCTYDDEIIDSCHEGEDALLAEWADSVLADVELVGVQPSAVRFVAWGGAGFDFQVLRFRLLRIGHPLALRFPDGPIWRTRHIDPMLIATAGSSRSDGYSLEAVGEFLGLGGKAEGMHGSKVYPAWRAGQHDKVQRYCEQDVSLLRAVYLRLVGE